MLEQLPEIMQNDFDEDSLVYINDNELRYNIGVPKPIIDDINNKSLQIYAGYYIFNNGWKSPKIFLICRGRKSGKVKIKIEGFYPYCYIKKKGGSYRSYSGEELEKVIFKNLPPKSVKLFKERRAKLKYPLPYEADVLFVRRFLIDMYDYFKPLEPIEPKIAILDIENNHPKSDDIISYAINDSVNPIEFFSKYDTQFLSEIVLRLYEKIINYDIIAGWNIDFDINAINTALAKINRCLEYTKRSVKLTKEEYINNLIKLNIFNQKEIEFIMSWMIEHKYLDDSTGVITLGEKEFIPDLTKHAAVLDILTISKKMYGQEIRGRWSLGNVGIQLAGIDKYHTGAKYISDLDENDLMEYNILDTIIPEIIDNILGGIQAHLILSWLLQVRLEDVIITAVVNDIALLRAYHKKGKVLPSRRFSTEDSKKSKYKAAEPDAIPGIYKGLIATDLVHAYPYAVLSKNISPETKDENGENRVEFIDKDGNNKIVRFNNNESVFIDTLKDLMEERAKVKSKLKMEKKHTLEWKRLKSIDFALKTQTAAFSHGIFGWSNSRMVDYDIADAITAVVRNLIEYIKKSCEEIDKKWVYTHTDAIYINAKKDDKDKVLEFLNKKIELYSKDFLVKPNLEYKGYYRLAYIHSKARNVLIPEDGDIDDIDTWEVTGMNFMRSETPTALAEIEIELIKNKFKGMSVEDLKKKLKDMILDLVNKKSTDLAIIKPLNAPIEKYGRKLKDGSIGGFPSHIKALKRAIDEYGLDIKVGDKFMVLPILTNETVGVRKIRRKRVDIAFDIDSGLPSCYDIDYEYYLKSNLWGKIYNLFNTTPSELEREILDGIDFYKKNKKEVCYE